MERDRRARRNVNERASGIRFKHLIYLSGAVLLILIITSIITYMSYNRKLKSASDSLISLDKITEIISSEAEDLESSEASLDIGKTIDEAISLIEEKNKAKDNTNPINENSAITQTSTKVEEPIKDPEFMYPVEGEIMREFAKDKFVFSETLQEWVCHTGVDIKADRTTIVKASEEGVIVAIKNDPRYGLTIIIEHVNGFKTIYSNLLTTEFVSEGEKIEKGQSIGTVGNSAAFEIIDPPHLHFEILKDEVNVDPTLYLK